MINYKRIVCDIILYAVLANCACTAPAISEPPCQHNEVERHYDQRQNGTENYRLNVDGVVIAVAPADFLFAAASDIDFSDLLDLEELSDSQKPASSTSSPSDKPIVLAEGDSLPAAPKEKSAGHKKKGYKLRLANILLPLLKKYRQNNTQAEKH